MALSEIGIRKLVFPKEEPETKHCRCEAKPHDIIHRRTDRCGHMGRLVLGRPGPVIYKEERGKKREKREKEERKKEGGRKEKEKKRRKGRRLETDMG